MCAQLLEQRSLGAQAPHVLHAAAVRMPLVMAYLLSRRLTAHKFCTRTQQALLRSFSDCKMPDSRPLGYCLTIMCFLL